MHSAGCHSSSYCVCYDVGDDTICGGDDRHDIRKSYFFIIKSLLSTINT